MAFGKKNNFLLKMECGRKNMIVEKKLLKVHHERIFLNRFPIYSKKKKKRVPNWITTSPMPNYSISIMLRATPIACYKVMQML